MFTIAEVIRLLTRIFVKQNKRFPKGLEGVDIRLKAKEVFDVGKSQGYKGGISEGTQGLEIFYPRASWKSKIGGSF